MTGFLWISVALALATPLVTRGSYAAMLLDTRWRWGLLFGAGVALSVVSEHLPSPGGHDLGFGALVASYALLLAFSGRNLLRTGMTVVLIGIACNAVAITVNHGMPVRVPYDWVVDGGLKPTVKHHATDSSTHLYWLTDVIYAPATNEVISFGDLILAVGLIDVAFHASRRRRRLHAHADDMFGHQTLAADTLIPAAHGNFRTARPNRRAADDANALVDASTAPVDVPVDASADVPIDVPIDLPVDVSIDAIVEREDLDAGTSSVRVVPRERASTGEQHELERVDGAARPPVSVRGT